MALYIFSSIFFVLEIDSLSPLSEILTSFENVYLHVHFVEIELLADVSKMWTLVQCKIDFLWLVAAEYVYST